MERRRELIEDPQHPALLGVYQPGQVHQINYHREERLRWEAVEIFLTLKCPLSCAHCITNSAPDRKERMSPDLLERLLRELSALGCARYVCLFGGEPYLEKELLRKGIELCLDLDLVPSSVTSGYWATTPESARKATEVFKGLGQLLISTDRYHLPFVSTEKTLLAASAALEAKINTAICYAATKSEFENGKVALPTSLTEGARELGIAIVMTPISHGGRACALDEAPAVDCTQGCGKLDVPLFACDGSVYACAPGWTIPDERHSGYLLGRFPDEPLSRIYEKRYMSPLLNGIATRGPLAVLAQYRDDENNGQVRPVSPCEACHQIMQNDFAEEGLCLTTTQEPGIDDSQES